MTTPWIKAFRDLAGERSRSLLVVLAIGLGIASFTSVLSTWAVLERELDREFLASNPPSATITTDLVDDELLRIVSASLDVAAAERSRTLTGELRTGPVDWRTLHFIVVEDFDRQSIGLVEPEEGAWPPRTGEVLFERDALGVARAKIGDEVVFKLRGTGEKTLRLTGTVHDVGQAQARMENMVYGYVTPGTLELLGVEPFFDRIELVASGNRLDQARVDAVASRVAKLVEGAGHPVSRLEVPEAGKHVHAGIMGLLLLVMSSFGFLILAVSGTLVVNLVSALLASQLRQVATLKTVGGSTGRIAAVYVAQAAVLGAGATLLAWPGGIAGGRVLTRNLARLLNFDVADTSVPWWVALSVVAVGIAVPMLSAALPAWRATRRSLRDAMDDHGLPATRFGESRLDRLVSRLTFASTPTLFAMRNGLRHRRRLALTLLTLSLSGLFFLSAVNVRRSIIRAIDRTFAARPHDLTVQVRGMVDTVRVKAAAETIPGVRRLEGWITTEASPASAAVEEEAVPSDGPHFRPPSGRGHGRDGFALVGLPADTELARPDIVSGRGLLPDDVDTIVVNTVLASRLGLKVGQTIELRTGPRVTSWKVVGIARESFVPAAGLVPLAFFEQHAAHAGRANSLRLSLEATDGETVDRVRRELGAILRAEGVEPAGSLTTAQRRYGIDQHMLMIYVFLLVMSALVGGVGALGLATTMGIVVQERRREIGVLRAIGASPRSVMQLVVIEGCAVALLGWLVAATVSWPFSHLLGDALVRMIFKTGLDFSYDAGGLVAWLAISIPVAAAASLLPARRAARIEVREALEYE